MAQEIGLEKMKVFALIDTLNDDFIKSPLANTRKGGLIGLSAVAVGIGNYTRDFLQSLLPPVISCFEDTDSKVRYYACESLYNISKVARKDILVFFNEIFDGLCKLFSDVDMDVRNGAAMLDRLIKEIVTESVHFNVEKFIPLLQKYISLPSAYVRRLLITWIETLDNVPEIDMLDWLPEFLGGLFSMLRDGNTVVRQEADHMIMVLLTEIKEANKLSDIDIGPIIDILVEQCESKDNFTRLSALIWISTFIEIGGQKLVSR
jgi:vacuole morphology and inheritance protein 14